jgi:hypothetical protein
MCQVCTAVILKLVEKNKISTEEVIQAQKDVVSELKTLTQGFTEAELKAMAQGNYKPTIH